MASLQAKDTGHNSLPGSKTRILDNLGFEKIAHAVMHLLNLSPISERSTYPLQN